MEAIVSAIAFLVLCALLFAASVTDIRERKIPNEFVVSVAALWLAWRIALLVMGNAQMESLPIEFASALVFGIALLAITAIAERVAGKPMMGGGDIKLLAAISLFLGIQGVLVALLAACVVSLVYAAARLKRGIPFAPCIMCGTLLALLA